MALIFLSTKRFACYCKELILYCSQQCQAGIALRSFHPELCTCINQMNKIRNFLLILSLLVCAECIITLFANSAIAENINYHLPAISNLPSVKIPSFKKQHPRLPIPEADDIQTLEQHNPNFFKQHKNKAADGQLYSRILIAYIYPEQVDLNKLYDDLIKLNFSGRGNKQSKPLAIAYDWLYRQWSLKQRLQLRNKLKQACEYQIHIIRDKMQLSPYNVFLYNSPLQALIASAIALHKDIPEIEDSCMRFTRDYWKNRVLPVWKQIMGKNGGWHEGGEYVGIGIGQAVYQIPAMWRNATGEDYFQSESGIKGFLDFLVFRTRPDGTDIRQGDASFFNRQASDGIALALEFQHKPAYNLYPGTKLRPTSWPWGPLTDNKLIAHQANNQLPLTKLFDGIGLIISRSSWDKDATYVTFKAGDNYWSHSHLDQGSFTIFKGGALAIDSGLYGSSYGSDHHFNYTYQSIAHNIVTITDPDDTLAMPSRKKNSATRQIANDGGQRRVGSGWGHKAPLDFTDWNNQKNIYHTAGLSQLSEKENILIAVADLTPAYTNNLSGEKTFAHRTKRVENYQRVFIHDKNNDLILIFDWLKTFSPDFRKKWLLHSLSEPTINGHFFHLSIPPDTRLKMSGGELKGQVILPKNNLLQKIGGKGFEYYVDGKNYDDNGKVERKINRLQNIEAGQWRIELQPETTHKEAIFLVALQTSLLNENKTFPDILVSRDKKRIICRINEQRTFIFHLNNNNKQITVDF